MQPLHATKDPGDRDCKRGCATEGRALGVGAFGLLATFLAGQAAPATEDLRTQTLREWRATCFEADCEVATRDRDLSPVGDGVRLVLEWRGAEVAGWYLAVEFLGAPPDERRALTWSFEDGVGRTLLPGGFVAFRAPGHFYVIDAEILDSLLPRRAEEDLFRIASVDMAGEPRAYEVTLAGLDAAMEWVEAESGMAIAPRLAIAPEDQPAPPLPPGEAARRAGIPEPVLHRHVTESDCEDPDTEWMQRLEPVVEQVSPTGILYAIPCTAGAYNVSYRLYVRETGEVGGVRTLYFASYSRDYGWSGTDLLFNVTVEGPHLTALYKGRGLGDCGTWGEWSWVDYEYRLDRFAAEDECRGREPRDWPIVYPPPR